MLALTDEALAQVLMAATGVEPVKHGYDTDRLPWMEHSRPCLTRAWL